MVYISIGLHDSGKSTNSVNLAAYLPNSFLVLADTPKWNEERVLNIRTDYEKLHTSNVIEWLKNKDFSKYDNVVIDTPGFIRSRYELKHTQSRYREIYPECKFVLVVNDYNIVNNEKYKCRETEYLNSNVDLICVTHCENGISKETYEFCEGHTIKYISNLNEIKEV